MALLEVHDLHKDFGGLKANEDISFSLEDGELVVLIGPNGAGKTTTIKMLCCLLQPTKGSAVVMGYDVNEDPMKIKQLIGFSPKETAIATHLNTRENLLLMG